MNWLKKYWWVILVAVFLLLLPLLINLCYYFESDCWALHAPSAWATFWATYFAAIASFAMVLVTLKSLKQNNDQLSEMKRQWEEEHRPIVEVYFTKEWGVHNKRDIEVFNRGKSSAKNLKIKIEEDSLDFVGSDKVKAALLKIGNDKPIYLLPNESYSFEIYKKEDSTYMIAGIHVNEEEYFNFIQRLQESKLSITGTYADDKEYIIDTEISCQDDRKKQTSIAKSVEDAALSIVLQMMRSFGQDVIKVNIEENRKSK